MKEDKEFLKKFNEILDELNKELITFEKLEKLLKEEQKDKEKLEKEYLDCSKKIKELYLKVKELKNN